MEEIKPIVKDVAPRPDESSRPESLASCKSGNTPSGSAPSKRESSTQVLTDSMILRLWTKMNNLYGHRWQSTYGSATEDGQLTDVAKDWKRGLKGITPEQIAQGLEKCLASGGGWPPTLPEFRKLCLGHHNDPHAINAAAYRVPEYLALPKPRPSRDKARSYLQALRAALKGETAEQ